MGAILIATEDTPTMIDRRHLAMMKKGALIMDVTCSYGDGVGYMPTFHKVTTVEEPVYEVDGILHFKMDRIPAGVPRTTSDGRSKKCAPFLVELGEDIFEGKVSNLFETCKFVSGGKICHDYLRSTFANAPEMQKFM